MNGNPAGAQQALERIRAALAGGDVDTAIDVARRRCEAEPETAANWDLSAQVYYQAGRLEDALRSQRRAVALEPASAGYLRGEATILLALDRFEEAVERFRAAIGLVSEDADLRSDLAAALIKAGEPRAAEVECRAALAASPDAPAARFNLGMALLQQRKLRDAERVFDELSAAGLEDPAKRGELARAYWALDRCRKAETVLRDVLEAGPDQWEAAALMGQILARRGRFEESEALLRQVCDRAPQAAGVLECLGGVYQEWEKPDQAREAFTAALALDPRSCDALTGLSHCADAAQAPQLLRSIAALRDSLGPGQREQRLNLNFAEARLHDRLHQHAIAWDRAVHANAAFCDAHGLRPARREDFRREALPGLAPATGGSERPAKLIVILGLPRSGKSTAEALAAGLRGAVRGYESNLFEDALEALDGAAPHPGRAGIDALSAQDYPAFADLLNRVVAERAGGASAYSVTVHAMYLLDSLPDLLAGLPNAAFVCLTREAWDNAVRLFLANYDLLNNSYCYRLPDIMNRIELWQRAVDWWTEQAPERILHLRYEELVADPAAAQSRLAAFCGLPVAAAAQPLFDDRGCAVPYREFMARHLAAETAAG